MIVSAPHPRRNSRLLLIFAGWGMDARPFERLSRGGYDIAVAYDYASPVALPEWIGEYQEICVLAWSYGVSMAERTLSANPSLPVTLKVAVNGTPWPVDDTLGIPRAIYSATLERLDERNVYKFYRRMCSSKEQFAEFQQHMPQRSLDSLRSELEIFGALEPVQATKWDIVYIADNDAIIPTANQLNAWSGHPRIKQISGSHLPDFQAIINEVLIDKTDVERKFRAHASTYAGNAPVQQVMCERVSEMLRQHAPVSPMRMLEIGAGTGSLTRLYLNHIHPQSLELWDLSLIDQSLPGEHRLCDAESAILSCPPQDVIASSATIQWMNNPLLFAQQCASGLAPGGVAVISTFGPDTFRELSSMLPTLLHYPSLEQWQALPLPEGCSITVSEERHTLSFASPRELLRQISLTGVNGCGVDAGASMRACRALLASDVTSLTYHTIYLCLNKTR